MRPFSRSSLAAVTATTMGVATFGQVAVGVLAADLIIEFGIDRWQIGLLFTVNGFAGALLSPPLGRVTDSIGSVKAMVRVLLLGVLAMTTFALSPVYAVLVLAALVAGIANGWANPATNALIVDNISPGVRGVVTGIKQSGVQAGAFLGGLLLPWISSLADWRVAYASFLVFPVAGLIGMWRRPEVERRRGFELEGRGSVPTVVKWVAVYGTVMGLGVSAITAFLPLFADESQGWTGQQAGLLVAGIGLVGVAARILWGSASERLLGHGRTLRLLALQSAVAVALLALASLAIFPSWVLVPAAILFGSGAVAWNAVGMLAVMDYSPHELVGRGTGLVLLGFLSGIGLGAPLMGLSVDRLGSYTAGWVTVACLFAIAAVLAGRIARTGTLATV